jgi:AcrR family transcriptional regulator
MAAKRKAKSPSLTEERIREAALALIDAEGLEGFSTRKLGAALGCEAMAIYWYYPSKDALLDAVVDTLMAKIPLEAAREGDWIDAFRQLARAYRKLATLHPKAFPLLATRRFATEGTYRFLEGLFAIASAQGIDDRTTARFYRAVSSYCAGVALSELAGLRETDAEANEARAAFPHIAAVWPWLEPPHYDDVFEFGLELLLDALARAPRKAASTKSAPKKRR